LSIWVACSHGIVRRVVVGSAAAGMPSSSAPRNPSNRAGSSPEACVSGVTVPAETWKSLSSPNSRRPGLPGVLLAASQPP
jgi:hypothetical protein